MLHLHQSLRCSFKRLDVSAVSTMGARGKKIEKFAGFKPSTAAQPNIRQQHPDV